MKVQTLRQQQERALAAARRDLLRLHTPAPFSGAPSFAGKTKPERPHRPRAYKVAEPRCRDTTSALPAAAAQPYTAQ
jgi:hypothetical protein